MGEKRTMKAREDRQTRGLTLQSLRVDVPDGAAYQDLPPTYSEAIASYSSVEKDVGPDANTEYDVGDADRPPRYSQINLHLT